VSEKVLEVPEVPEVLDVRGKVPPQLLELQKL
jgi:hypothetical protein